jgi:hypothetical protein
MRDNVDNDEFFENHGFDRAIHRDFADPTGRSALRAETPDNPRNLPCPTCRAPNRLTARDHTLGYQCDACADRDEGGAGW